MLSIKDLCVNVGDKKILDNISFDFEDGKNYCLLGKNGSGKSSLAMSIAGNPRYTITGGEILLDGTNLKELGVDERSRLGIFLSFQNIPEIPGVKLFEFLKTIYDIRNDQPSSFLGFKKIIKPLMQDLGIDEEFLWRDLNVGFSGGEKRKLELLQIKLINPKIIILDEIDSGLDVNAIKQVSLLLKEINSKDNIFIIITHLFEMVKDIPIDSVIILENGKIKETGTAQLINIIKKEGF